MRGGGGWLLGAGVQTSAPPPVQGEENIYIMLCRMLPHATSPCCRMLSHKWFMDEEYSAQQELGMVCAANQLNIAISAVISLIHCFLVHSIPRANSPSPQTLLEAVLATFPLNFGYNGQKWPKTGFGRTAHVPPEQATCNPWTNQPLMRVKAPPSPDKVSSHLPLCTFLYSFPLHRHGLV